MGTVMKYLIPAIVALVAVAVAARVEPLGKIVFNK